MSGEEKPSWNCQCMLNKTKHKDLIELIEEIRTMRGISQGQAIREILLHGADQINKLKLQGKYGPSITDRA